MITYGQEIGNKEMIEIIRRMCNHVDPRLIDHGFRVSWVVSKMLPQLGIKAPARQRDICLIALLHDIGAYKTEEIDRLVQFETHDVWAHSIYGALFTKYFSPLADLSAGILYHHTSWTQLCASNQLSFDEIQLAQLLHLTDRFDIMLMNKRNKEEQRHLLNRLKGSQFDPELVDVLLSLNLETSQNFHPLEDTDYQKTLTGLPFTNTEIDQYLHMVISIIDFTSRHTVTHTLTAVSIAYELGRLLGFDAKSLSNISCGALLHDLGKIAIPLSILESPGRLNAEDMEIMKTHVVYTDEILKDVVSDEIRRIAVRHHEKLDGSGYPKGLCEKDLTLPEKIVAVADILSALSGTRSYKKGFDKQKTISILSDMAQRDQIDSTVTDCVISHFDHIMNTTQIRCKPMLKAYESIIKEFREMSQWLPEKFATIS